MLNSFTFNGHSSDEFGIRIEKKPALKRSARKFHSANVFGRNGNIYELQDAWEEVVQPYEIFAGEKKEGAAVPAFGAIMEWLNSANGYAQLYDSYDTDHYRMAVFIDSTDIASEWHDFGRATVQFRCRPEHYLAQDPVEVASGDAIINETNHVAHPLITLTGTGAKSLVELDGRTLESGGLEYQTTELNGLLDDSKYYAVKYSETSRNITVSGSVRIPSATVTDTNGVIEFSVASASQEEDWGIGITMPVQANTDYTISCEAYNLGRIYVCLGAATGWKDIIKTEWNSVAGEGWLPMEFTFHTPSECGYALIIFARQGQPSGPLTQQYRKVMINQGAEAFPFQAHGAVDSSVKINNTVLKFVSNGFNTAVIDCERENFTVDGVTANQGASVVDSYGNLSAEYLQLAKGENTITISGDITAVEIDPRFWEL